MVLAAQAIEIFLGRTDVALLTLKFFLYVLRIKVCHEGYSLHSREISHLPHSGMFLESDVVEIHSIIYTILSTPVNSC